MEVAPRSGRVRLLGAAAVGGCAAAAASVTLLALARPDVSVSNDPISEYVHGPLSYVQIAVFFTVGVSSLALARGTWLIGGGRRSRSAALLVALWGVGMILGGIIDVEDEIWRTQQGAVHNVVVKIAFLAVTGAMALVARWRRRLVSEAPGERWRPGWNRPAGWRSPQWLSRRQPCSRAVGGSAWRSAFSPDQLSPG